MKKTAGYYRYQGMAVRLYKGRLDPSTVPVAPGVRALVPADGRWPRAAKSLAPLPKRLRRIARQLKLEIEESARKERLREQGIEVVENELRPQKGADAPWTDLGKLR